MSPDSITSLTLQQISAGVPPGSSWPRYHAAARELEWLSTKTIPEPLRARVAVLASFTIEPFLPARTAALAAADNLLT